MTEISLRAPAKVNLGLRVLRKRRDGYHEVETILQMVSLYDELVIGEEQSGIRLEIEPAGLPLGQENLIYRAADILARASNTKPAVRIHLTKKIPVSAGLGGGSSDAAAVLVGLNRLWNLGYSKEKLMELGSRIGSDVPFFLFSASALATGRGEILKKQPPPSPPVWIVLINPGFPVSTPWAFEGLKLGLTTIHKHISMRRFSVSRMLDGSLRLKNDLEGVTARRHPVLKDIIESLKSRGAALALMSGSGPTLFGVFPNREAALAAHDEFAKMKGISVFLVHTLKFFPSFSD